MTHRGQDRAARAPRTSEMCSCGSLSVYPKSRSTRLHSQLPLRERAPERDPPRGDCFFKRKKLAAWVRGPLGLGLDARGSVLLVHFDVLPNYLLCLRRRPQIPLFAPA